MAEILSKDKQRISITGWFYGPLTESRKQWPLIRYIKPVLTYAGFNHDESELKNWINPLYLQDQHILKIQDVFSQESQMDLFDFLLKEKYNQIKEDMNLLVNFKNGSISSFWEIVGPPNIRRYCKMNDQNIYDEENQALYSDIYNALYRIQELNRFFTGSNFQKYLQNLTNLKLESYSSYETRCYHPTHYTLVHDENLPLPGLDFKFDIIDSYLFNDKNNDQMKWDEEKFGSCEIYMDSDEHLLTIEPHSNKLSLVFRCEEDQIFHYTSYTKSTCPGYRTEISMLLTVVD